MMKINTPYWSVYEEITNHKYYLFSLIGVFFFILIYYFITWPIVGYDTDLWYHLSGGKYFWQNGVIAKDAFFSYITPPKSWYDYYWLFQVIIYKIFQWTGYGGLVALRCSIYLMTAFVICLFFINLRKNRTGLLIGLFFFVCFTLTITFRELLVRPHLFSYLFIVVFLYILELKRDKIWLLPFLGILWVNIHGIEYPVMVMIILAYLAEIYYHDIRKKDQNYRNNKKAKWSLILTIYTIFISPHIVEVINTPFNIAYNNALYQQLYVAELIPIEFSKILVFPLWPFSALILSFQLLLMISFIGVFFIGIWKRDLRISHVIIFIGSLVLLIKYNRFIYEFILLSIPIVRHGIGLLTKPTENKNSIFFRVAPIAMIIFLIVIPSLTYGSHFKNRPEYPFTQVSLPTGVTKFLNDIDAGGHIMNEPNTGGYMQWALSKKYKIYMDMQLAIFNDQDFAFINNALNDENTFRLFINKYNPSFLSVSLNRTYFKEFIRKFNDFKPVFFDDTEVLYVNAKHFRQIADAYELKNIDVFQHQNINYETENRDRLSLILNEANKLHNIYPGCGITNTIIANILIVNKQYEKALFYAEVIIRHYPDFDNGYSLKADALFGLQRFPEAAAYYRKAIDMGAKKDIGNVYRNLHVSYIRLKEFKKAYRVISEYVNPFNSNSNYKDIYDLGMAAAAAGKLRDAVNFLKIAEMKLPPADIEYTKKIKDNLLMLDPESKNKFEQ